MNCLFTSFGRNKIVMKYSWIISNSKYSWIVNICLEVLLQFKLWILCILFLGQTHVYRKLCTNLSQTYSMVWIASLLLDIIAKESFLEIQRVTFRSLSRFDLLNNWIYFLNCIEKQKMNCFGASMLSSKVWLNGLISIFIISMLTRLFCT